MRNLLLYLFIILHYHVYAITIISWNIRDFGHTKDDQDIKNIANLIRNADIVAIQEVVGKHPGGAKAVARLADQLNRMGSKWDYVISDPTNSTSPQKSERYAYLWKTANIQITGGGPRLLTELAQSVEREPFLIQFKVKGTILNILNYHACTHTDEFPERSEILRISEWLLTQNLSNIIWAGDMNLEIRDVAFKGILKNGFSNVFNGQKTTIKRSCVDGNYLSRAEDNILYSLTDFKFSSSRIIDFVEGGDCNDVSWKWMKFSDHLGLEMEIDRR